MRAKIIFIAAILMGIMTTFLFFNYMKQFDKTAEATESLVEVVAAKQAIAKNKRIEPTMLELIKVPELGLHPQAVKAMSDVEGSFAESDIEAGEILLGHRIKTAKEEADVVSRKIRTGYRAVSVGVNFVQSVSNLIEPGDEVDVVYTPTDPKVIEAEGSKLLFEKVKVLAVGRKMVETDTDHPYAEYSSATLEMKAQDIVELIEHDELGIISLALHSRITEGGSGSAKPAAKPK